VRLKKNLVNNYLYRDKLGISDIRKPEVLEKLLQAIVGFEFKWSHKNTEFPENFITTYKAKGIVIEWKNFREVIKI
jgi:hypothetical protein